MTDRIARERDIDRRTRAAERGALCLVVGIFVALISSAFSGMAYVIALAVAVATVPAAFFLIFFGWFDHALTAQSLSGAGSPHYARAAESPGYHSSDAGVFIWNYGALRCNGTIFSERTMATSLPVIVDWLESLPKIKAGTA